MKYPLRSLCFLCACCLVVGCSTLQVANFPDLRVVEDAAIISFSSIPIGSPKAVEAQRRLVAHLPLEVETAKTGIRLRLVPLDLEGRSLKGLYVGKYEVTQGQWERVMGSNPSEFKKDGKWRPVETVLWKEVCAFLEELNRLEGVPEGTYRLPTKTEWQHAARAGTDTDTYVGNIASNELDFSETLDLISWYKWNSQHGKMVEDMRRYFVEEEEVKDGFHGMDARLLGLERPALGRTMPVGLKVPNAYGLYDMIGNVSEMVLDPDRTKHIVVVSGDPERVRNPDNYVALIGQDWLSRPFEHDRWRNTSIMSVEDKGSFAGFRIVRGIMLLGDVHSDLRYDTTN